MCVCVIIAASATTTTAVVPLSSLVGLWYRRTIGSTTSSAVLGAVVCDGDAGVDVDSRNGHGTYAASEKLSDVCPPPLVSRLAWPISYNDACGPHPAGRRGCAVRARNDPQQRLPPFVYVSFGLRTVDPLIDRSTNARARNCGWSSHHPHFSLSFTTIVSAALNYSNERTNDRLSDPINPLQKY